jgi:hypothetical protein
MIRNNSTELQSIENFIEEVDLDYRFLIDNDDSSVYIKFDGFKDDLQMKQFTEFMYTQLPLLFIGPTKH